jgi:hypothetical protein
VQLLQHSSTGSTVLQVVVQVSEATGKLNWAQPRWLTAHAQPARPWSPIVLLL